MNCGEAGRQAGDLDGRDGFDYREAERQIALISDFLFFLVFRNVVVCAIKNEDDKVAYIVEHRVLPI